VAAGRGAHGAEHRYGFVNRQKGRYLSYGRDRENPHNGLLVSVLNQFGMNLSSFGDPS
jgi:hypothetical protein